MVLDIAQKIATELNLKSHQVENVIQLLDEENTIPFIARYRKEMTGELDEVQLRQIDKLLKYLRHLQVRKEEVIRLIQEQGKLTPELKEAIEKAEKLQEVEDLYLPYKPKRRTRATIAKEKGLEPLAQLILQQELETGTPEVVAESFVNPEKGVPDSEEALKGAMDIVAEIISDDAEVRKQVRAITKSKGVLRSTRKEKVEPEDSVEADVYQLYFDYQEPVKTIPPHRLLAINRGEKRGVLRVTLQVPVEDVLQAIEALYVKNRKSIFTPYLLNAIQDSYKRLIAGSIETDIRAEATLMAEEHALKIFSSNLKNLLLQPPVRDKVVLGIDPGYRTGCKVAVVDETGKLLATATIYPHPPQSKVEEARKTLEALIEHHKVDIIAIGNGTASRETEVFVAGLIKSLQRPVKYIIVDEAGASVYSASEVAAEEFPDLDVSLRGTVSICRRLQDPLAELVKIDPKSIGVGQYQHDVDQRLLSEALDAVVESCVNYVGVDVNTASVSLLKYVSGITAAVAKNIVQYRNTHGKFTSREELKQVPRLGEQTFVQAAGFLRIAGGTNPLDNTPIHPESYEAARGLLKHLGLKLEDLNNKAHLIALATNRRGLDLVKIAHQLHVGLPTLKDILTALERPGRDPRSDLPLPVFRSDVMEISQLKVGMVLKGIVRNVVDFGVFVDIGVKQDGLIHISELSHKYIKHPMDVVSVGQVVDVKVINIDERRGRIGLSMKF
ncbi:MAG TPA: Tex family protein [Candidatus Limnocylindrales bacterium]|nr:Tex family protein [Candidatus Limnocylindrales bacterium]